MIKKLLFLLVCVATTVGAWGQIGTYGEGDNTATISADGTTLTISGKGDLTAIGTSSYVFINNDNGKVFAGTGENYSQVNVNDAYNQSYSYVKRTVVQNYKSISKEEFESTYIEEKSKDVYKLKPTSETLPLYYDADGNGNYYNPTEIAEDASIDENTWWDGNSQLSKYCVKSGEEGSYTYTYLSLADLKTSTYCNITQENIYVYKNCNAHSIYYKDPNRESYNQAFDGYEYNSSYPHYARQADTYEYSDPMSLVELENNGYVRFSSSFVDAIKAALVAGTYTKVEFSNQGGAPMYINNGIVRAIFYPTNDPNTNPYTSITNIDFGAATLAGLSSSTFYVDGSSNNAYMLSKIPLVELTLPLVPAVGGEISTPANVISCWGGNTTLTTVHVPAGYTKIGSNTFYNASKVQNITLPEGITDIEYKGFYGCTGLSTIALPNTLVTIGNYAFAGCYDGLGNGLTSTPENPFVFPTSLRKIGTCAFDNCKKFLTINLNSGLEFIGNSAFYSDSKIATQEPTLDIPSSVQYIGPGAFFNRNYADIYFHSKVAPVCPVGPSYHGETMGTYDIAAFGAETHMGNNGFNPYKTEGSTNDDAYAGYANRENYINNGGIYFTILHFPAGITIEQAKTYKDVTRRYVTALGYTGNYEDNNFYYGGSVDCGEEQTEDVKSFKDYNAPNEPWRSTGAFHKVAPGYKDTYLGEQKIWPSQNQWMRAYTTVANGVEWNGVTTYRPTVSDEMIDLMIQDGLMIWDPTSKNYISINSSTYTYTEASAAAYNETLPGALTTSTVKTPAVYYSQEEADANNLTLEGHIKEGETLFYTTDEINAHNATLDGAVKEGDVEVEGHDIVFYTWEEYINKYPDKQYQWQSEEAYQNTVTWAYNQYINGWDTYSIVESYIESPAIETTYYTAESAAAYNANLPEAWNSTTVKGTATAESAAAYNATLPGAWTTSTVKTPAVFYTAQEAKDYNAKLPNAVTAGSSANVVTAFSDYLSKIAYQSTRRFVLADDGSYQTKDDDKYEIDIKGQNWWTLCLPFNMTKKEVDDVFGEGTHVCLFSGVDRDASSSSKHITLKFQNDVYAHKTEVITTTQTSSGGQTGAAVIRTYEENFNPANSAPTDDDIVIQAFEAYMIFPKKDNKDAAKFYVPNPRVEQGSPYPTIVEANTQTAGNTPAYASSSDHTEYRFVGNLLESYVSTDANGQQVLVTNKIPQYSYMYAKKKNDSAYKFWFNKSTTISWAIKKCVVQATAKDGGATDSSNFFGNSQNQAKETSIFGDFYDEFNSDNDVTNIEKVTIIAGEGDDAQEVYNLNGQQIYNAPAKSVYIKNGRKYIAR